MTSGRWLGVDVGSVRVGLAISDPDGLLATPLATVGPDDLDAIEATTVEYDVVGVVVGLPRTLDNRDGPAARTARAFADRLRERLDIPVEMYDERLSTAAVSKALSRAGISTRRQRTVIDQAAAASILQGWLDARGRTST